MIEAFLSEWRKRSRESQRSAKIGFVIIIGGAWLLYLALAYTTTLAIRLAWGG